MSVSVATIPCGEPGCDRSFGSESARDLHIQNIHVGVDQISFACRVDTCSASFGTALNRDEHMREAHKPPGAPTTAVTVPSTVASPVAVHSVKEASMGDPSFVCDQVGCGAAFDGAAKLGTHRWSKHKIRGSSPSAAKSTTPGSFVDRLLADEDEVVTIELRGSLAKRLLDIVLAHGDGVDLDFTDPASLRREADRIELEQAVRAAVPA